MSHRSQYGDGVANPSRPPFPKGHSQSFTAGSNPNSAPMPSYSNQQHRRQSQPAAPSRSYTPQPEPTFDLMSSSQPMFGDVTFQMPNMSFDLHASMSMSHPASPYTASALPGPTFPDNSSFGASTEPYLANGISNYGPDAFTTNTTDTTDFAAVNGPDTSFSRSSLAPSAPKVNNSPFTANGPILAPPPSSRQGPTTDSMHKNQPQTPRKVARARSVATAQSQQSLVATPTGIKTPLAQRDANTHAGKRALPESPTLEHTSPRKAARRSKTDEPGRHRDLIPIPAAESFPPIDPGEDNAKPPYTYAQMIALAIWKAPYRRRTLAQIYDFIRTTWSYYQRDDTWENSIRHNLSLHKKFFEKQARAKDDPGKGNYWLIIPGNERELLEVYLKERPGPDGTMSGKTMGLLSTARLEPSALPLPPFPEPMLPPQVPDFSLQFPQAPKPQSAAAPLQPEPSSDATIPASEAFEESDLAHDPLNNLLDAALTSSPPAISRRASAPNHTPTRTVRYGGSSGRTSGKRKRYSMVDSGYMTGLESSILRYGPQRAPVFSSDADTEFQGGGRAEDAIRKMRASSNDSPSKGRTLMLPPSSPLGKGSPLRYRASPSKLAAPAKTPANTKRQLAGTPNLLPPKTTSKYNNSPIRQHDKLRANVRSMLETPQCIRDYNKKYPGRRLNRGGDFDTFAIFEDSTSGPELESPLPANSAGRMLDELMSAKKNQKTTPFIASSPFKTFPLFPPGDENAPWTYDSPSKIVSPGRFLSSPSKFLPSASKLRPQESDNWIVSEAMDNLDDEIDLSNLDSFGDSASLDLTQTFRSIGERPVGVEAYGPSTLHQYG
ncbi:hypothetical protein M406DRAFT_105424 [Cryphonectria parasitica EP155]|uniref:Fork-head domain-containing protein n=1 Tax=Cryphonectria parasitica (strain ATCC 38755 / EP155) TaxID=660469 RepID=A0A9P4YBK2_CRYP1|nr:uncharacterized protein M406DRAFT_105424 [Cryphonectria parasitica EP155]KAF3770559.1 hypothetical protein M406DRAFT_105424 [Cryphonectria parasitica EP155]